MRICVIGGGTAEFIAAAHVTRYLPDAELLHVFDASMPTIGVGEGTTPRFPVWFSEVTGLGFDVLAERCGATLKKGVRLDGWGPRGMGFTHRFQPLWLVGYHFDVGPLADLLGEHIRARRIDAKVEALQTTADGVLLRLADGATHRVDYVVDARGFPRPGDGTRPEELVELDWIPTGRAMLRRLRPGLLTEYSRAAARPHGWILQVPLQHWTSCGYVFNPRDQQRCRGGRGFRPLPAGRGYQRTGSRAAPSGSRTSCAARFSTAASSGWAMPPAFSSRWKRLPSARRSCRCAGRPPGWPSSARTPARTGNAIAAHNAAVRTYTCRDSLFIAWHYAKGARWDTPFWRYAQQGIERARKSEFAREHVAAMEPFIAAGAGVPGLTLAAYEDKAQWSGRFFRSCASSVPTATSRH